MYTECVLYQKTKNMALPVPFVLLKTNRNRNCLEKISCRWFRYFNVFEPLRETVFCFLKKRKICFRIRFFSNSAWWKDAKYFSLVLAVTADFFDRRRRLICRSTSFRGPHSTNCLHCKRKNKEPVFQVFLSLYRFSGFLLSRVFQENVEIFFRGKKGQ